MTRDVASVNGSTPFRDVAEVLIAHRVSAVPVVDGEGHVIGVVSEADLLHKEEFREQYFGEGYHPPLRARLREHLGPQGGRTEEKAHGETAAELMTAPAITVRPYTSVVSAARIMDEERVKRLPVVDDEGRLEGIISRHDVLKVFVRTDDDIAREVRDDIVEGALWADTSGVHVRAARGVVTLSGQLARRSDVRILVRMTERVNGVIEVVDRLAWKEDDTPTWATT
ncbi:CBS domain-containing protein [Planotetraspora sp. A-T 1434]|uniref:CBS domain-containing protein n=1 Tax=Planotetraspora sp. A-T 1434 TaxID=2979219 RepID=UPI0021C1FF63|nr:CBS domain-containing protein [Planotetraspora sp. A-T 1434]MCT9933734.1 CBS domain-containing protein [Planotetraspora sp. A-T 1434]